MVDLTKLIEDVDRYSQMDGVSFRPTNDECDEIVKWLRVGRVLQQEEDLSSAYVTDGRVVIEIDGYADECFFDLDRAEARLGLAKEGGE